MLEEFPSHAVDVGQVCVRMRNPNIQNEMEEEQNQDQDQGHLNNDLYACPDPYCQKQYVRSANLEKHLALGNHLYRKAEETGIDCGIKIWVEKCSAIREKYAHICEKLLNMYCLGHTEECSAFKKEKTSSLVLERDMFDKSIFYLILDISILYLN